MASHCRRSSRQVPPNLCRRIAARPHVDRPDVHAADGRFSTPRGGHGDVWALSARDLRRDSVVCDTGYARATGSQRDRAAGGTSCRDAPGRSPLGIKAVTARQGGKRSRCSRRSAGTAGAGSGRASRRGVRGGPPARRRRHPAGRPPIGRVSQKAPGRAIPGQRRMEVNVMPDAQTLQVQTETRALCPRSGQPGSAAGQFAAADGSRTGAVRPGQAETPRLSPGARRLMTV